MNRYDFRKLAATRLEDASVLLRNNRYEACYYLSGYVVECALKACIARLTKRYDFPDKRPHREVFTHDLKQLLKTAELMHALDTELQRDPEFARYWLVVKEWREQSRYEMVGVNNAQALFNAVANRRHGVLRWLKRYW